MTAAHRWRRQPDRSRDTGSMPLAMLLTMLGLSLSAVLGSTVVGQVHSARRAADRSHALSAAQTGLDVGLGSIRAAVDAQGKGVPSALPCGPDSGTVPGTGGGTYRVEFAYYAEGGSRLACPPQISPAVAKLRSYGTGDATTGPQRILGAAYQLRTPGQPLSSGMIHNFRAAATDRDLCLDAGVASPAAGDYLRMQPCDPTLPQQRLAYVASLALALPSSRSTANPRGMCLDAVKPTSTSPTSYVRFQPCVSLDGATPSTARQMWTLADFSRFEGTDDGINSNNHCLTLSPGLTNSLVVLAATCGTTYNTATTLLPEVMVGTGAAGERTGQLVNSQQFGRCLDVTDRDVNYRDRYDGTSYLTARTCSQAPNPNTVSWNQKWTIPTVDPDTHTATGQVTVVTTAGARYCLKSPRGSAANPYVFVTACSGASTSAVTWTRYTSRDDETQSYTLVDADGRCLQPSTTKLYPQADAQIGRTVVAACDGSPLQKWNVEIAPSSRLTQVQEQ